MEYFRLSQDKRYLHTPIISNLRDIVQRRADTSYMNASKISDINVGFAKPDNKLDFVDILDDQIYLVSDEIKLVFKIYEPGIEFKAVCILDNVNGLYRSYHIPILREIDCLSPKSIVSPDRTSVKELVLIKDIPQEAAIFKAGGLLTDIVIIRLDVVESILRRKYIKFNLKRLTIDIV